MDHYRRDRALALASALFDALMEFCRTEGDVNQPDLAAAFQILNYRIIRLHELRNQVNKIQFSDN